MRDWGICTHTRPWAYAQMCASTPSAGPAVTAFFHSKLLLGSPPPRLQTSLVPVPLVPLLVPLAQGCDSQPSS